MTPQNTAARAIPRRKKKIGESGLDSECAIRMFKIAYEVAKSHETGIEVTRASLAKYLGVTVRTVSRDIDRLQLAGINIGHEPSRRFYFLMEAPPPEVTRITKRVITAMTERAASSSASAETP